MNNDVYLKVIKPETATNKEAEINYNSNVEFLHQNLRFF